MQKRNRWVQIFDFRLGAKWIILQLLSVEICTFEWYVELRKLTISKRGKYGKHMVKGLIKNYVRHNWTC